MHGPLNVTCLMRVTPQCQVLHKLRICSFSWVRNAHVPYSHLWLAPLCKIFPPYLINGTIFEEKSVFEHKMCVLVFCTSFVRNISHSKKIERDIVVYLYWSSFKVPAWIWTKSFRRVLILYIHFIIYIYIYIYMYIYIPINTTI